MTEQNNGGAAFPLRVPTKTTPAGAVLEAHIHYGMTLRDWFAGQALVEWSGMVTLKNEGEFDRAQKQIIAAHCYEFADAMLAVRGQP